ncbi:MAG: hypothetical protein ACK5NT_05675, partial [Pyrinomonadaceae bacterium]
EIELNGEEFTSIESAKSKSAMPQYNSRRALQLKYIIAKPNKALSGVTIEIKNKVLSMKTSATLISNGKDVIVNNVTEVNGVRTNSISNSKSQTALGASALSGMANNEAKLSAEKVYRDANEVVFPLLLTSFIENSFMFRYVGKAESDGIKADVLERIMPASEKGRNETKMGERVIRYFFDSATQNLLMIVHRNESTVTIVEESMYFSEYKQRAGVLIPTRIKIETNIVYKKPFRIMNKTYTNLRVKKISDFLVREFQFNFEIPDSVFENAAAND